MLIGIPGVSSLETFIIPNEVALTYRGIKAMVEKEFNEDELGSCFHLIDSSTFISCVAWMQ